MKYRLWHRKLNKYLLEDEYLVNQGGKIIQIIDCSDDNNLSVETLGIAESKNIIIEQFIGQLDFNNKEIYEGDLILHTFDVSCSKYAGKEIICLPGSYMATKQDIYQVMEGGVKHFLTSEGNHIGFIHNNKYEIIGNARENNNIVEFLKNKPESFTREDWIAEMFGAIEASE